MYAVIALRTLLIRAFAGPGVHDQLHVGQAHAAGVAAVCSGLRKLILRRLDNKNAIMFTENAALFTALAPACTQFTHLVLDSVLLQSASAEESLSQDRD